MARRCNLIGANGESEIIITRMADKYHQLLDAAVLHLEGLKARGARFVSVSPEILAKLSKTQPKASSPTSKPVEVKPAAPRPPAVPTPAPVVVTPPAPLPNTPAKD